MHRVLRTAYPQPAQQAQLIQAPGSIDEGYRNDEEMEKTEDRPHMVVGIDLGMTCKLSFVVGGEEVRVGPPMVSQP